MQLIPADLGPLNPEVEHLTFGLVLFGAVHLFVVRCLPRVNRVLLAREAIFDEVTGGSAHLLRVEAERMREVTGALLSEARRDAARIRQEAREEGAALIASARADGLRERAEVVVTGQARVEAERAAAEAELRGRVSELASALASRIVGEPIPAPPDSGQIPAPPNGEPTPARRRGGSASVTGAALTEPGGEPPGSGR
ncbi:hypothetical protein AB0B50_06405 [Streptomyces sp. NPDC041068]|uniref:F0F1 ATP synthase subunit B family protein n=1 Tax=Streptomyces sp. NPDC041068 TaxID=3155130 RepID=UPI0033E48C2E